jgi:hypothetical protein
MLICLFCLLCLLFISRCIYGAIECNGFIVALGEVDESTGMVVCRQLRCNLVGAAESSCPSQIAICKYANTCRGCAMSMKLGEIITRSNFNTNVWVHFDCINARLVNLPISSPTTCMRCMEPIIEGQSRLETCIGSKQGWKHAQCPNIGGHPFKMIAPMSTTLSVADS